MRFVAFLLSLFPGLLLVLVSILVAALLVRELFANPQWVLALIFLGIACGILAWIWTEIPLWFRKIVRRLLGRDRRDDRS
jgi:predicted acyltransferase